MSELDDAAFERAYRRMMLRWNIETLRREAEGASRLEVFGDPVPERPWVAERPLDGRESREAGA